jgi:hypothetical protein
MRLRGREPLSQLGDLFPKPRERGQDRLGLVASFRQVVAGRSASRRAPPGSRYWPTRTIPPAVGRSLVSGSASHPGTRAPGRRRATERSLFHGRLTEKRDASGTNFRLRGSLKATSSPRHCFVASANREGRSTSSEASRGSEGVPRTPLSSAVRTQRLELRAPPAAWPGERTGSTSSPVQVVGVGR